MFLFDFTTWMLVFTRAGAMLAIFPILSGSHFPVRLRLALAGLAAFLVAPLLGSVSLAHASLFELIGWLLMETGVGLLMGFISRMAFYAIDFAGTLISMEIGLNLSGEFNPFNQARSEAPGLIIYYLAAMLLFSLDLHHWILYAFQRSYDHLPIGGAILTQELFSSVLARAGSIFALAAQMSAPIIAVGFLINFIFALLSRAVPQMNVFAESFAFRTLGGLAVFGMSLNLVAQHLSNQLARVPEDIIRVSQLLRGG